MAQSDKVNVLPQEVTAKYSNPQTGINGAKREEVVFKNEEPHFYLNRREGGKTLCSLQEVLLP